VAPTWLLTVTGLDAPGIAAALFDALVPLDVEVEDVEQIQVQGRLLLCVEVAGHSARDPDELRRSLESTVARLPGQVEVAASVLEPADHSSAGRTEARATQHLVTVLGPRLDAGALAGVFGAVARAGGNADRVVRLSRYPVTSYELVVSGGESDRLRRELAAAAAELAVDVAVQRAGLHRRAKHLIVLDADSTLLQGEVIDLLAERAGHAEAVAELTTRAMAGELPFTEALRQRVSLLAGLDASALEEVSAALVLAPGARTLLRTLRRLGYVTAVVSGGFTEVVQRIGAELGIDYVAANELEVVDGRLTGELVGPVVDRAGKAAALRHFAEAAGVPLARTVAVGDGANDIDMLAAAGLGIAYNAKPAVREAADTALNVPYLDAVLFLLGIPREEIEEADALDA